MSATARWLPLGLLLAVAAHHAVRVHESDLTQWNGGGFGMFSTTDGYGSRHVHLFVTRPGFEREVRVPAGLERATERMLTWPSERRVASWAREVGARLGGDRRDGEGLLVQVFRRRYETGRLAPSGELIRQIQVPLDE